MLVYGDEYYSRVESTDGYTLVRDPLTRVICYANLNKDGSEFLSTGVAYTGASVSEKLRKEDGLKKGLKLTLEGRKKKVDERQELMGIPGDLEKLRGASRLDGDVIGLTLLVEFTDEPATIPKEQIRSTKDEQPI